MNMVTDSELATVTGSNLEIWAFSAKPADAPANQRKQARNINVTRFTDTPLYATEVRYIA
jgi:hypothetical protein